MVLDEQSELFFFLNIIAVLKVYVEISKIFIVSGCRKKNILMEPTARRAKQIRYQMIRVADMKIMEDASGDEFLPPQSPPDNFETDDNDASYNSPSLATSEELLAAAIAILGINDNAKRADLTPNHSPRLLVYRLQSSQKPNFTEDLMAILKARIVQRA